jgi:hypothetical protein
MILCQLIRLPNTSPLINRKAIKEYLNKDSVIIGSNPNGMEAKSTMKDSFGHQPYPIQDLAMERNRVQQKLTKNTIVFGMDKNNYFKAGHSRTTSQDLSQKSKESKIAAESVKQKLQAHNFKFGSFAPDYHLSSNLGDKQLSTQDSGLQADKLIKKPN